MAAERPVALIIGASSGIGLAYADRLPRRGLDLILVARRKERLQRLSVQLAAAHGVDVEAVAADLTRPDDLTRLEDLIRNNSRLQVLVNNAGVGRLSRSEDTTDADAALTLDLNVVALTRLARAALPGFIARDAGTLINVASVMAVGILPVTTLYSATKSYESVTFPTVEDASLWSRFEAAREALFAVTQAGNPARRYGVK